MDRYNRHHRIIDINKFVDGYYYMIWHKSILQRWCFTGCAHSMKPPERCFFCTALADCHQPNEWHKVQVVHCLANWFIICGHPQVSSVVKPFDRSGFLSSCEVLHRWSLWDDWPYQTVKCWLHLGGQLIIWVSIYCNMWCRPAQQMVDGM